MRRTDPIPRHRTQSRLALVLAGWSRRTLIMTGFFDYTPTGDWTDVFRRPSPCVRQPWTARPARCGAASDKADFAAIWKGGVGSIFAQLLNRSRDVNYFDVQERTKVGYEQSGEKKFSARLFLQARCPVSLATRGCWCCLRWPTSERSRSRRSRQYLYSTVGATDLASSGPTLLSPHVRHGSGTTADAMSHDLLAELSGTED